MFDTTLSKQSLQKRIDKFTSIPEDKNQCWIWTGMSLDLHGSPMMGIKLSDGTWGTVNVNRVVYWLTHGDYDEDMIVIRDPCNNPICINPAHMKLIKKEDHNANLGERFLMAHGEDHHNAVLNDDIVTRLRAGKLTMNQVMKMTGVSYTVVRKARLGITWKHLPIK